MSDRPADEVAAPPVPAWPLYRTLVGVGVACGLGIVLVWQGTAPIIATKRAAAREAAVFRVLPGADRVVPLRWTGDGFEPGDGPLFAAYGDGLVGVAIQASGMGYQDTIDLLYGYAPAAQEVVGLEILQSRETPGLGTRVETDPAFRAAFAHLDVTVSGPGLAHPVEARKPGRGTERWHVDTLSGATISSRAVTEIVGRSAAEWAPRVQAHRAALEAAGAATARPGGAP